MRRPLRSVEFFADRLKSGRVGVVAVYIPQQADQLVEGCSVDSAVFLKAVVCPRAKLFEVPTGFRYTDHRHVEGAAFDHRLQRGKNLFVGQIACGAKKDQGVGMGIAHCKSPFLARLICPLFLDVRRSRNASPKVAFLEICPAHSEADEPRNSGGRYQPFVCLCSVCLVVTALRMGLSAGAFSHRRNPPAKALALLPARQPGGSFSSCFTFPPPRTTSSGSSAAIKRATTSATWRAQASLPQRSRPRCPT